VFAINCLLLLFLRFDIFIAHTIANYLLAMLNLLTSIVIIFEVTVFTVAIATIIIKRSWGRVQLLKVSEFKLSNSTLKE